MIQDFKQVYISPMLEPYFGEGFREKWDLSKYNNPNQPSIFLGMYSPNDEMIFKNHNSYSIMVWGGADQNEFRFNMVRSKSNFLGSPAYRTPLIEAFKKINYPHKIINIPFKEYDNFKPTPLGNKIYVYKGIHGDRSDYFKWNDIIQPLIEHFGPERIIYTQRQPINILIKEFYNNGFIYVKPNEKGGNTTMWELGHMGRKTIAKNQGSYPNILDYSDLEDMISIIHKEEKNIGGTNISISKEVRNCMGGGEWLDLNFWMINK